MDQRHKSGVTRESAAERAMRDSEVLRANGELAAYFKGRRTEREARAALKTIKAFIRNRERLDPGSRPPLPGADSAKTPKKGINQKTAGGGSGRHRPTPPRKAHRKPSKSAVVSSESTVRTPSEVSPESDERTP